MLQKKKCPTPRQIIAAMGLTIGLVLAPQAFASSQMGYVTTTGGGQAWMVSGECLRGLHSDPQKMEQCGDVIAQAAPPPPPPAPEPRPTRQLAPSAAAPAPAPVTCDATVHFDFDRSVLKAEMRRILDALANDAQGVSVRVVGHTDSVGTEAYNMGLSNRRAKAVADYLATKGVTASEVIGRGESSPVASNATREGRAQNRRAEVSCR